MTEALSFVLFLLKLGSFVATCTMGFAFGLAFVWRWMEWSPVNITVNLTANANSTAGDA